MPFSKQNSAWSSRSAIYLLPTENKRVFHNPFDNEYLRGLRNRDVKTEEHFCAYFKARLRTKLLAHRLKEADIQEIMQETFGRVLESVYNNNVRTPGAFGGFVSGVCDNVLKDFLNGCKFRERFCVDIDGIDAPDPTPGTEDGILRRERQELVKSILDDLSPKDRELLRAKIFEELSQDEMCRRFGLSSPERLRVMLHRARSRFAKACRERGLDFSC